MATQRLGIGLPVHNGGRYLAEVLDSLRAQTYKDFEVLVCDNSSTDNTPDICAAIIKKDNRFRYERKPVMTGCPENFNHVFRRMDNELFAWCADDDLHHPDFYSACVRALDAHPAAIGGFTAIEMIDAGGHRIRDESPSIQWEHEDPGHRMADLMGFEHACQSIFSVFRRSVLATVGPMCTCWGSDRVLLAELALHGPVYVAPERFFLNRDHSERVTYTGRDYYGAGDRHKH